MFEIGVPMWQYWLSQSMGILQIFITLIAFQTKNKSLLLGLFALANVFAIISNGLLLNFIVSGTKGVSLFKNLSFSWLQKNRERVNKDIQVGILILFCMLAYVVVLFTWDGLWFNWILFVALAFSYYGEWAKGIHIVRIGGFVYAVAMIVNALMFANFTLIIVSLLSIGSIIVFYIKLLIEKKKKQIGTN